MQTAWKKKVVPGEEPASLKIFYTSLEEVVTMKHINRNCIKESAKLLFKKVTQIIKKNFQCGKEQKRY